MIEGNIGEFTPPLSGDARTVEKCTDLIADVLPEVEAEVGEFPDTVNTVGPLGLG